MKHLAVPFVVLVGEVDVLSRFKGRLLAADESPEVLEGDWPYQKVVLIEFKNRDEAARRAASAEYRKIAIDREESTVATVLSVRGLHPWSGVGTGPG